jgi:ComF family protein
MGRTVSAGRWRTWLSSGRQTWALLRHQTRRGYSAAVDLVFPPLCALCHAALTPPAGEPFICNPCRQALALGARQCRRCGTPLAVSAWDDQQCAACRPGRLHFESAVALGAYRGLLREAVLRSKRLAEESLARALGGLLAEACRQRWSDRADLLVVPVPMQWRRRWRRGANSAEMIAEAVARQLELPLAGGLLRYRRATAKQGTLTPRERLGNVRDAFAITARDLPTGRRILLVDDVMTSGATANELAKTLRRAGAGAVRVAVLARGLRSH